MKHNPCPLWDPATAPSQTPGWSVLLRGRPRGDRYVFTSPAEGTVSDRTRETLGRLWIEASGFVLIRNAADCEANDLAGTSELRRALEAGRCGRAIDSVRELNGWLSMVRNAFYVGEPVYLGNGIGVMGATNPNLFDVVYTDALGGDEDCEMRWPLPGQWSILILFRGDDVLFFQSDYNDPYSIVYGDKEFFAEHGLTEHVRTAKADARENRMFLEDKLRELKTRYPPVLVSDVDRRMATEITALEDALTLLSPDHLPPFIVEGIEVPADVWQALEQRAR